MDDRKLRLYRFLLTAGRMAIAEIPEPYRTELKEE